MRPRSTVTARRAIVALTVAAALLAFGVEEAGADPAPEGQYPGPSVGASAPTAEKPESKLWYTDGSWWSVMVVGTGGHRIHRLDEATQAWSDTGVVVESASTYHVDALWDGAKLYVASHQFDRDGGPEGYPSNLHRFSYDAGADRYTRDAGFPQQINDRASETLVIAKDSLGRLWATWTQGQAVWMNRTTVGDTLWGAPFALPGGGGLLNDDISSVIAYGGDRIGVMWSDQDGDDAMKFASRRDVDLDTAWTGPEIAVGGSNLADDHINLKTDANGKVYAATKTSRSADTDPLVFLLVRGSDGSWTNRIFGRGADNHTRPIVLIHEGRRRLYLYATAGSSIYVKETSLDDPSFGTGLGRPVIDGASVNNATSTKEGLTDDSGIVVQASGSRYWHYWNPLTK